MDNVLKEMEITPMLLKAIFLQHAGLPFRLTQLETNMEMGICGGELRAAVPFLLREGKLEAVKNRSGELLLRMNKEGLIMLANQWVAEDLIPYDPFKFVSDMAGATEWRGIRPGPARRRRPGQIAGCGAARLRYLRVRSLRSLLDSPV